MLSGLKFIPRDEVEQVREDKLDDSAKERKKSKSRKKHRKKKEKSRSDSSDDELGKIRKRSKKKNWHGSDDDDFSSSSGSDSLSDSKLNKKRKTDKRKAKKKYDDTSEDEERDAVEKADKDSARKDMGLDWMLRPKEDIGKKGNHVSDDLLERTPVEETKKVNPKEMNPYWKDDGSGYPDDTDTGKAGGDHLFSSSVVGDGGASWRLKALKRAKEQAARDGRKLDEVVEERWGSLGELAVSVASRSAAPSRAHLTAIHNRKKGPVEEKQTVTDAKSERAYEKDVSTPNPNMRIPKRHDSLSWGKGRRNRMSTEDATLVSSTLASLNKFSNDGSFMSEVTSQRSADSGAKRDRERKSDVVQIDSEKLSDAVVKPEMSANQIAAKVMQLRLKGKHEEADNLLKEAEKMKAQSSGQESASRTQEGHTRRYVMHDSSVRQKKNEEDADMHLATKIMQNKKFSISGQADDEYDYDEGPRKKRENKGGNDHRSGVKTNFPQRILTQHERCQFCFENPSRPRHLVISIANFVYLMLPQWQPIVPGHCCILPMQHEASTRNVDNNVWDEIRNFKKCLIMMFAKQEKEVVFIETVMGLAQQRRHCLVECIPLPEAVAKQAPLYFKKAIDEAEDEWSQHNAKKLIDTSVKGLRASIPKDFPYFHVEFGLSKGFVHVIDDETSFKSNFGLNVLRGMLKLPAEDMHSRRKHESVDSQKVAVRNFNQEWEPFDWTKQLD
ncbi:uncharacterized protein LOC108196798 [Daucus carota subsp. sativus]|uniref:uncharacterized protein LOC108196798 n=1 Tax=Daucus carota subsp. sativus TaxID=79200 RepID=UPI0007EF9FF7|nr:PREDICTED: CWF19-like protein 2 [Daucus carota subsp. sativus]